MSDFVAPNTEYMEGKLNNCASHSRYFSDELDAQFFIKIS